MNYYVAPAGSDTDTGTAGRPFRTIQRAADIMRPGDTCHIRGGIYREWVKPPRGGASEEQRIAYRACPGEIPEIKGSERMTEWRKYHGRVWRIVLPNAFFGSYNPYALGITGEWLEWTSGLHRGDVYLNGLSFTEKLTDEEVADEEKTWCATVDAVHTTILANFGAADPNAELAEINVRELVFFPDVQGLRYITVDGLSLLHAANNWAPPESFQRGLIGTNWGRNWIIENCHVADAKCVGICSGKHDPAVPPPSTDLDSAGHHIVRNNWVRRCGQAGIAGNMGFGSSLIQGNLIEDINHKTEFGGEETAGIKVHNAVDVRIENNVIRRVCDARGKGGGDYPGIWIDWCNQGARLTGNIVYDTDHYCAYLEACHGPMLVDNNLFIGKPIRIHAKRIVLAHNLFCDSGIVYQDWEADQRTPAWFRPHTRETAGTGRMRTEGNRFYNNIFIRSSLAEPHQPLDCDSDANLYIRCAGAVPREPHGAVDDDLNPTCMIRDLPHGVRVSTELCDPLSRMACATVSHERIGTFPAVDQGIEDGHGKGIVVDTDMLGKRRHTETPTVGPVENPENYPEGFGLALSNPAYASEADVAAFRFG